jgi:hypothetical protein
VEHEDLLEHLRSMTVDYENAVGQVVTVMVSPTANGSVLG